MQIQQFINNFKNHPVLFFGTGMSLRYLENSYNWNDLLQMMTYKKIEMVNSKISMTFFIKIWKTVSM